MLILINSKYFILRAGSSPEVINCNCHGYGYDILFFFWNMQILISYLLKQISKTQKVNL